MAATSTNAQVTYYWQAGDALVRVAGRYLADSGFGSTSDLVDAIANKNPTIGFDPPWHRVPVDTYIVIPVLGR